jgi:hypothetical protein
MADKSIIGARNTLVYGGTRVEGTPSCSDHELKCFWQLVCKQCPIDGLKKFQNGLTLKEMAFAILQTSIQSMWGKKALWAF